MRLCVTLSVLLAQAVAALAQERLPIIDMHMHASSLRRDVDGVLFGAHATRCRVRDLPHKPKALRTC